MKYCASTETTLPEYITTGMELKLASFDVGHVKESPKVRRGDIVGPVPKLCFIKQ